MTTGSSAEPRIEGCNVQHVASREDFDEARFTSLYRKSVKDIFRFWTPSMQDEVARHCYSWRRGATDFQEYLLASEQRYAIAYQSIHQAGGFTSLCDVGGFFGAFALTLARMGHSIAMTEALEYYSQSFVPLFQFLGDSGVRIIDYDPFGLPAALQEEFDAVSVMAVLEHYPHSLQGFMRNVLQMLNPSGRIYIEVPNIAYWPKRKAMLAGRSPLAPVGDIYRSSVPFIGHHHEFTREELEDLATMSNLKVLKVNQYNYSFHGPLVNRLMSDPLLFLMSLIPSMRECVAILASRT
jgi:2-polyprenyl-3-methyl-5-hydroxy-6-metoxy-1,4-benzoquinol methylase